MQPLCCGVESRAWSPSIMLSRHHPGQPCFKQNQVEDFLPKNNKQQQSRVRQSLLPPSLPDRGTNVWFPRVIPPAPPSLHIPRGWVAGVINPHLVLEASKITVGFYLSG